MRNTVWMVSVLTLLLVPAGFPPAEATMTLLHETAGSQKDGTGGDEQKETSKSSPSSEAQGMSRVEGGVTEIPDSARGPENEPLPDRRWIIKESGTTAPPRPSALEAEADWKSKEQESRCRSVIEAMGSSFRGARYHSIRGDACRTAQFSSRFLDAAELCRTECPDGFLERHGYTSRIVRNVRVLLHLGRKRCLGDSSDTGSYEEKGLRPGSGPLRSEQGKGSSK